MAAVGSEQQLRFRWNDHMQHVSKILTLQRLEEQFCDVSLVSEDGFVMKAHQAILASTSAYFQRVLSEVSSDQHPMIVLRGANFREMSCLLDYMYQGNTQVDQSLMESVLEVADMLEVKGLSRIRSNATIKKFMVPCSSPSSTNGSSLHMPCTDNIRGSSRDEEQFYRGNQADTRTSDTEGARMRLTSNICENRSSRENPHLSADGPPMSHAQPHSSRHESDPQDDEDVTQTSGIDLSLAKNEPWSPRDSASLGPKDDSDDEESSPSKKKRKHQENLCSEETLDPVSDPDWGRIGTKLEERPCHKPRTISLSSVTTVDAGQMSGLLNDDEWTDEDTAIPGPAEALRSISAPPILPVNKHRPLPDSLVTNHTHTCLPPSSDFVVINHSHASTSSSSSSLSVPSASITCAQRLAKYPQSHSYVQPCLSNLEPVPAVPQNISVRSSQHTPISDSLNNGSVDDQNTQNAIADPEQFSEENLDSAYDMFQTSIVKKCVSDGVKTSFVRQAYQESQTAYKNLQPALRNSIQSSLLSSEGIQSSLTQRNKNKISASSACITIKKECPSDLDSHQPLERNVANSSVVCHMNTIKQEHQEETLKSNIKACSLKTDKSSQTKYVEIRLNEGKFKSKFPVPDLSINNKEENGENLNNMIENHPPKEEEPLCPLEKKMKRPRSKIKRPMNQYMLFQKEMREKLRAQHPEESNQRIAVWLGYLWRQLPVSEKAKWQARADYVKKEHKRLYPHYSYNPREASEERKKYITTLTERRNLYRIKPQVNTEEN